MSADFQLEKQSTMNLVESKYRFLKTLGIGTFGKVKLVKNISTGKKYAIKIVKRDRIKDKSMEEKLMREINIMKQLNHKHIIRFYDVIESDTDIYLVLERARKGNLLDLINSKDGGRVQEDEARKIFGQIIDAIEFCHENKVVHRDLKAENILMDSKNNVKVADFGFSVVKEKDQLLKTTCCSPFYAAPEILCKQFYGCEVDIWSCGVILYAMLCGKLPFEDESYPAAFKKIKSADFDLPGHLSSEAGDLISKILVVDPKKRFTISEIRKHSWFDSQNVIVN
ncbi:SNF1-related protein kinase catalytic subunit alpha KIN11-like [Mercurialis annua]|uniref:SNF1-related protein kinase catalytic subunit alpha KIN11-like n=1 Tax=Mercurialis annua TaxID=3986 RepID=UPI0021608031|nr:SNF1-related protein kinase catalytic subunit alpha KIN11-like [Mercurialis annua]